MAVFVAAAGTAFQAQNFGTFPAGEDGVPVRRIDGALNWATAALNSLRLFQTLWFDRDGDAVQEPHDGDFQMGRLDYQVILPLPTLPEGSTEASLPLTGLTTVRFIDMVVGQHVGTLTLAPYDLTVTARLQDGRITYAVTPFNPIYSLFRGDDQVTLGNLADTFYDPDGALVIDLGGGNDVLVTEGGGADTVRGGAGDDRVQFSSGGLIQGGDGNDTLLGGGVENDFTPATLEGGAGEDSLQGFFGNDVFVEGEGSGDDVLDGHFGIDRIDYSGAEGPVTVDLGLAVPARAAPDFYTGLATGGSGTDYLISIEQVSGSGFDDSLWGDRGDNLLQGNGGDDLLQGGFGADTLEGGTGRDMVSYAGDFGDVQVNLATGAATGGAAAGDVLTGFEAVTGGFGHDRLTGDAQDNLLSGGMGGRDTLRGLEGDDTLQGGAGSDTLLGGLGQDRFVYVSAADSLTTARDVILDFDQTPGARDRIDLRGVDAVPLTEFGNEAFVLTGARGTAGFAGVAGELRLVARAGGTEVRLDLTGDGVSDMEIFVKAAFGLTGHDFLL